MIHRLRHRFLALAVAFSTILGAMPVTAQSGQASAHRQPLSESLQGTAKEAYESAKILLNNRDWQGAFTKFQQAHDLSHDPRLLFNMAICARDLRAYARMQRLLVRYKEESAGEMSREERADIDAALATIKNLVGTVRLTVSEADAAVAVDGEAVGTTPLVVPLVIDLGKHTLSVAKSGFNPVERVIESSGGGDVSVAIVLVAEVHTARLVVVAEGGATVTIDKDQIGNGRFDGPLPPGPHQIQVTAPGKKTYESLVDLREGETRRVDVTLVAAPAIWPWIVGGSAVAVGAVVGGYFLLRPRDQRVGPTGSLDTIVFTARTGRP